ncbi:MAG TPA: hypothetical protein VK462_09010 [Nitrososphaeraceae archaeon]|nr:hypothetical protein [Nitrososphaeraceae archaeon]
MGKLLPSASSRIKNAFLKAELVSHVWDTTGEDYGPPAVNDDDRVKLSVQYF